MQIKRTFLLFLLGSLCANQLVQASTILQVQGELTQSLEYNCFNRSVIQGIIQEKIDAGLFDDVNAVQSMLETHKKNLIKALPSFSIEKSSENFMVILSLLENPAAIITACGMWIFCAGMVGHGLVKSCCSAAKMTLGENESTLIINHDMLRLCSIMVGFLGAAAVMSGAVSLLTITILKNRLFKFNQNIRRNRGILEKIDSLLIYIAVQRALSAAQAAK